jgi:hypothetical protein
MFRGVFRTKVGDLSENDLDDRVDRLGLQGNRVFGSNTVPLIASFGKQPARNVNEGYSQCWRSIVLANSDISVDRLCLQGNRLSGSKINTLIASFDSCFV